MKITIKLSETNNALLNRVVKEEKVDASEFANSAFLDKFLPVSEKLGIEAGFILQEHEAGTLDAWLVKQCISRGIRWLGNHPIRDCAILKQILVRFPFSAKDNGKISTCNECVQSDMDSVVALLKERVPGYVPSKDEYNGLVEDVLANWKYIWNEAIVCARCKGVLGGKGGCQEACYQDGRGDSLHAVFLQVRAACTQRGIGKAVYGTGAVCQPAHCEAVWVRWWNYA